METFEKFDGIDYANTFARRISIMHELIKDVLSGQLRKMDIIIDIGGGPGMGARIIDELGVEATFMNIEPSTAINDVPRLSFVKYIPLKMTFKEALYTHIPYPASCMLMVSSEHEIALCNGRTPLENKKEFFHDLNEFIHKNLKKNGCLIIGFPNYRNGASKKEIARQRKFTESLLGHSHPPEEFFTIEEFSSAIGVQPDAFIQKPMTLAYEKPDETILRANVAVFKLTNTGIS